MAKFYITTSLPYTNASPHIGFALEAVQADVIARWQRIEGKDVYFLTGTDEHGAKITKAAEAAHTTPEEFTDKISGEFRNLVKVLDTSTDDFIRTTDRERHWPSVKVAWEKLKENGDLYTKEYEGLYCVGCEAFITKKDLEDGLCRIHKRSPEVVKEENRFFKLSKYSSDLKEAIESDKLHIVPQSRKNEILEFIKEGLQDVSFSRPRKDLQWGVPVPEDDTQTIYVWADALVNYISALGYPDGEAFKKYWPADVHIVGKDILRFHATIWPAMLLSLGLELPKTIFVHGFITVDGQKMSKTIGNVVDPFPLVEKYGADAVRYFLLREIPSTADGDFTQEKFEERYNADLASGLGNLVARVLTVAKTVGVSLPKKAGDPDIPWLFETKKKKVEEFLDEFQFSLALEKIWESIQFCDRLIERIRPWEEPEEKKEVIGDLLFAVSKIAELLEPFLPETSKKIKIQLSRAERTSLFPRIET
jgi:methionyl-tRNA synthetase